MKTATINKESTTLTTNLRRVKMDPALVIRRVLSTSLVQIERPVVEEPETDLFTEIFDLSKGIINPPFKAEELEIGD